MRILFGFWPRDWSLRTDTWAIEPVSDFPQVVCSVKEHDRYANGWIYPPLVRAYVPGTRPGQGPLIPSAVYSLPATHTLVLDDSLGLGDDFADYALAVLGLAEGLRLVRDGWTHFYKAPVEPHKISDLFCSRKELEAVLGQAQRWWSRASLRQRTLMFGAVHWHLFSSGYEHEFEEFGALYAVLDTLYAIHMDQSSSGRVNHGRRPSLLATEYRLREPPWAKLDATDSCTLASVRNELVHEARYGGAPIGFAYPDHVPNLTLELRAFLTRLILAILGLRAEYVSSSVQTRQLHGLGLLPDTAA